MKLKRMDHMLALIGGIALLLIGIGLTVLYLLSIQDVRRAEVKIKGRQAAVSLAASLARAYEAGIPFDSLVGLDALVATRQNANPDIQGVFARTSAGLVLHQSGKLTEKKQKGGAAETILEPITANGVEVGIVTVLVREPLLYHSIGAPLVVIAILLLCGSVLLRECAAFGLFRGVETRADAVERMAMQVSRNDFTTVVIPAIISSGDAASSMLANRIRSVNEKFLRLRRLVHSLRNTEPDPMARQELTNILVQAEKGARFAEGKPVVVRLGTVVSDARWLLFLSSFVAEGMRAAMPVNETLANTAPAWSIVFAACGTAFGLLLGRQLWGHMPPAKQVALGLITMLFGLTMSLVIDASSSFAGARGVTCVGLGLVAAGCSQAINKRSDISRQNATWFMAVLLGGEVVGPPVTALLSGSLGHVGALAPLLWVTLVAIGFLIWIQSADSTWQEISADAPSPDVEKKTRYGLIVAGVAQGVLWGICLGYLVTGEWAGQIFGLSFGSSWALGWLAFAVGGASIFVNKKMSMAVVGSMGLAGALILGALPWLAGWSSLALLGVFLIGVAGWKMRQRLWQKGSRSSTSTNALAELIGIAIGGGIVVALSDGRRFLSIIDGSVAIWFCAALAFVLAVAFSRLDALSSTVKG